MAEAQPPAYDRASLDVAISSNEAEANLLLAWREAAGAYRVRRVQMDEDLAGHFLDLARKVSKQLLSERIEIDYDPEWPLNDHEYFALPNDPPVGGDLFGILGDYANLDFFNRRDLTKPRLYVVAVHTPDGIALFGKRMGQSLSVLTRRGRGVVRAVFDGSTFTELEASVATFSTTFDWVVWPGATGTIYVLNSREFHAEFRDVAALMKNIEDHVLAIRAKIEIENHEKFIERCQRNVQMASKLKHAVEHGILGWSVADLKQYSIDYDLRIQWHGDSLVFEDSIEGQWNILKLLDEDRTEGPVSHRHYESAAKRQI